MEETGRREARVGLRGEMKRPAWAECAPSPPQRIKALKQSSGCFYTHSSPSRLVFCCICKRFFYFNPLNMRPREPGASTY